MLTTCIMLTGIKTVLTFITGEYVGKCKTKHL